MKKFQAYIAADGSLHKTPTDAALADLMALGITGADASLILKARKDVAEILRLLDTPYNIPTHFDVAEGEAA